MQTTIEWTARRLPSGVVLPGFTFNIVWGCQKVSEGCQHCYADTLASRYGFSLWGPSSRTARRTFGPAHWQEPLRWNRQAERLGHRLSVFCSSMGDTFEVNETVAAEREKLWPLIERTPWLNWLLLTKRPQHILQMVPWGSSFPDNVWIGTSVENQRWAGVRVPRLLAVPSVVRFLSVEPLLGPVTLAPWLDRLSWVIVGGESGAGFRPCDPSWVRALRDECVSARVPFFFKQWGGLRHTSGGRLLDGREWSELPPESPAASSSGSFGSEVRR